MQERIETIIREWLKEQFGNDKALPELVLSGLAKEIVEHRWEIYTMVQEEYDMDDIETMAEANDVELTDDEKSLALHRYKKCEDSNLDILSTIIDDIVSERDLPKEQ